MANYPTQLDEIDQWLFDSFGIVAGACSSTENLRHNTARMIAETLWPNKDHIADDSKKDSGDSKNLNGINEASDLSPIDSKELDDCIYGRKPEERHCEVCSAWCPTGHSFQRVQGLDEAAEEYAKDETMAGLAERAFKAGANWQREQLRNLCYQCEKNGETIYYKGMKHAVEQMKKEAIELTVYLDDDGYPCIPEIVLFDFDKNQPTAKEGDRIKVYIFRDNKE